MEEWLTWRYCATQVFTFGDRDAITNAWVAFSRGGPTLDVMLTCVTSPVRSAIVKLASTLCAPAGSSRTSQRRWRASYWASQCAPGFFSRSV